MKRVDSADLKDTLRGLVSSSVSGSIRKTDEAYAAIQSFQSSFKQLTRTPEMIRIMMQNEFNFEGAIDAWAMGKAERAAALRSDWYDSTFAVADYSDVEPWLAKAVDECEKGRLVVIMVPSRTNTRWFHDLVLETAKEVRFVKGKVVMSGRAAPSANPDCIVVYRGGAKRKERRKDSVAIMKCTTDLKQTRFELLTDPPSPGSPSR